MCGIFGLAYRSGTQRSAADVVGGLEQLFALSETRGREAAGLAIMTADSIRVHKDAVSASHMLRSADYKDFIEKSVAGMNETDESLTLLGHTRLVTNGLQVVDLNNQPARYGGTVAVHNGIIINHAEIWDAHPALSRQTELDTEALIAVIDGLQASGTDFSDATAMAMAITVGEASIGVINAVQNELVLASNTGSLYLVLSQSAGTLFFVSELYIAEKAKQSRALLASAKDAQLQQVKAGDVMTIDLSTFSITRQSFTPATFETQISHLLDSANITQAAPNVSSSLGGQRQIEEKHAEIEAQRAAMIRCSACLLPETMPFIRFGSDGVCNFCENYTPATLKGEAAWKEELAALPPSKTGADCLLAFSGGRDSSYAIHLLVEEYGIKPVAYTYDWGMVTDLGRRNQARMCGALGVEHIWVSADIRKKRDNIRRNVSAWLRNPNLGMIPLFMAGDKQFYWYAVDSMKKLGVDNIIFCSNQYERTDFKTGFAGIAPEFDRGDVYSLSQFSGLKLAAFYGAQFLRNPAYLNRSIPDTVWAYFSYYLMKRPFLDMFQYLPWEEETINDVLINQYDWETSPDTPSTWRIGDGTAPFYNYIYHRAAGFTEAETFRSNQIRSGVMSRETAMALVEQENAPRWDAIRDYCQLINLNFQDAMKRINSMPRLYDPKALELARKQGQ